MGAVAFVESRIFLMGGYKLKPVVIPTVGGGWTQDFSQNCVEIDVGDTVIHCT